MINLAIIEDNEELRNRLKELTHQSAHLHCEIAVDSVEKFLSYHSDHHTLDIILLDIGLPGMSGIAGIPHLKNRLPEVEVVILTVNRDPDSIFNAICAGASGYLLKDTNFEELENQLVNMKEKGGSVLSPQIARRILHYFQKSKRPGFFGGKSNLTKKESQVVRFLVDGHSYQNIGGLLGITIDGVRFHVKNIYKKLEVRSRTEVVKKYLSGDIRSGNHKK